MGVLVEDLLALARLDERRDVVIAPVDLRPIARDAALDVRAASPLRAGDGDRHDDRGRRPPPPPAEPTPEPGRTARADGARPSADRARRRRDAVAAAAQAAARLRARRRRRARDARRSRRARCRGAPPRADARRSCSATRTASARWSRTCSATRGASPPRTRPSSCASASTPRRGMGWIEVVDHGEGIPEQIRDKIFQRFWRADTSRTRETGGTGPRPVDRRVDRRGAARHGRVDDTPGGGATFRVAFPLAEERDAAEHLHIETQPHRAARRLAATDAAPPQPASAPGAPQRDPTLRRGPRQRGGHQRGIRHPPRSRSSHGRLLRRQRRRPRHHRRRARHDRPPAGRDPGDDDAS